MLVMTPKEEEYCEDQLKIDEGFRSSPYQDTEGIWTIGYGKNMSYAPFSMQQEWKKEGIHRIEALILLRADIINAKASVCSAFSWANQLQPGQKIALVNMCYNVGIIKLLKFKNAISALKCGDLEVCSKELLHSKWATQVKNRATRIVALINTQGDEYAALGFDKHS